MDIRITAKQFDLTDALKAHIHKKFEGLKKFENLFSTAEILLAVEKYRNIAKIGLKGHKEGIHCEAVDPSNMYHAIDLAMQKAEKMLIEQRKDYKPKMTGKNKLEENLVQNLGAEIEE